MSSFAFVQQNWPEIQKFEVAYCPTTFVVILSVAALGVIS